MPEDIKRGVPYPLEDVSFGDKPNFEVHELVIGGKDRQVFEAVASTNKKLVFHNYKFSKNIRKNQSN